MQLEYPCYRTLEGADTLYAVEGPRHVTEWQPVGSMQWVVHHHFASNYPGVVWVKELFEGQGQVRKMSEAQWAEAILRRTVLQESAPPGRPAFDHQLPAINKAASLREMTTFGVEATAQFQVDMSTDGAVRNALIQSLQNDWPILILGGGSNVLMHADWEGLVARMTIEGHRVLSDDGDRIEVVVGAGESWHDWVMWAVEQGWNGLENLALIPGSVGASPMQNIGAYGVEVKDRFLWLEAIHRTTGALERFDAKQCAFGYRESVFKRAEKDQWVIVRVAFALHRSAPLQLDYGAIRSELTAMEIATPLHRDVAEAVMRIRRSKLPDPQVLGNAGSFFKNPIVSDAEFQVIQSNHPHVVHYAMGDGNWKLAAGWLIEQAGWKGHRRGACGVHEHQALVLVNFGGANGRDLWQLAKDIMADVREKFGVQFEPEVNQVGH